MKNDIFLRIKTCLIIYATQKIFSDIQMSKNQDQKLLLWVLSSEVIKQDF